MRKNVTRGPRRAAKPRKKTASTVCRGRLFIPCIQTKNTLDLTSHLHHCESSGSLQHECFPAPVSAGSRGLSCIKYSLVGSIGLEPTTPTMSRWCSNQLSYEPTARERDSSNLSTNRQAIIVPADEKPRQSRLWRGIPSSPTPGRHHAGDARELCQRPLQLPAVANLDGELHERLRPSRLRADTCHIELFPGEHFRDIAQ